MGQRPNLTDVEKGQIDVLASQNLTCREIAVEIGRGKKRGGSLHEEKEGESRATTARKSNHIIRSCPSGSGPRGWEGWDDGAACAGNYEGSCVFIDRPTYITKRIIACFRPFGAPPKTRTEPYSASFEMGARTQVQKRIVLEESGVDGWETILTW